MINMELGPSTIVGVGLTLVGVILYFVKTKRPNVSRDYDLFFSSVGLLCGGILIFQGWRLDPILLLCQILSSGTAIFFIGESLWLRGIKYKSADLFPEKDKNVLQKSIEATEVIKVNYSFRKETAYQEKKISSWSNLSNSSKELHYTAPIEYF